MKHQDLNHRQARWAQYLSWFKFKWLHEAGATMGKADALSWREDHAVEIEKDNTRVLVIPSEQISSVTEVHIATDADIIIDTIKDVLFDLKEPDLILLWKQYILKDHIFYDEKGKIYIPNDQALHLDIVKLHHYTLVAGHPGREKTLELVQRSYTWPGMSMFIKEYTNKCERCAQMKPCNLAPPGKLHPLELPDIPWTEVTVDFTTDLPLSNGLNSILIVVDCFLKEVEFISCNKTTMALDTARLYLHNVWKNHGLPSSIVLEWGPQFASQVMKDLCKWLGIQPKLSTAFHSQMNGQTERMNRDLQ